MRLAPVYKAAIAAPIATSYANTYKVAASYPAYGAYHGKIYNEAFNKSSLLKSFLLIFS